MQKLGMYWKIQDICYHIGTDIFKIEALHHKPTTLGAQPSAAGHLYANQFVLDYVVT